MSHTTTLSVTINVKQTTHGLPCPSCNGHATLTRHTGDVRLATGRRPAVVETCSWCDTVVTTASTDSVTQTND